MRKRYYQQLETVHNGLIRMGALCEDAIASAARALLDGDEKTRAEAVALEHDIDMIEREIESMCVRLLLHQQPMASDLRRVTAAQMMIIDMERIGDQAADIADISAFMTGSPVKSDVHIADMARATAKMVTESIDSFVREDLELARSVIRYDDAVDDLFSQIKRQLIERLRADGAYAQECLDLLMIAKYFERIGDHAVNIAGWVIYFLTGNREVESL
ncbi:MAG: phosphate signaling complex protein PhoU [Oscillospiraceae bacterium]|jgi:phosphate transport system protein|nr:phosphate signaling complex protein PhoU [Oscillospiraceae bacterium]